MPYKDPQKQKEYQERWKAEHPEKIREYWQESEKRETTKETRKRYRNSEVGKKNAKGRRQRYFEKNGGYTEVTKNYPSRQKDAHQSAYYKCVHGITLAEFEAQIAKQNNLCPIGNHPFGARGRKKDSPCQDHDHESGENRLILCRNHNVALGLFNDSIEDMQQAISYLSSFKKEKENAQLLDDTQTGSRNPATDAGPVDRVRDQYHSDRISTE